MNASVFKPGNKFVDWLSISQAAVDWQGLTEAQQRLVVVNGGMPFLAGVPDLQDRAEALLDAAQRGLIDGLVHNEDGHPLGPEVMRLNRVSLQAFIDSADAQSMAVAAPAADTLLRVSEVLSRLAVSRATLYRQIDTGKIEQAHETDPPRWRRSYIDSLVAGGNTSDPEEEGI